jgi:hypothetical protein
MLRMSLAGGLCLIAISNISRAQDRDKTTFNFTTSKDGLVPLIHVILHNGGTGTFVFDTGTNVNYMSDILANTLKLPVGPVENADGSVVNIPGELNQGTSTPVLIGSYLQQDTLFMLIKASRLGVVSKQLNGILGWLFMRECAVLFDFHKHEITLWSSGNLSQKDFKEIDIQDAIVLDQATPETTLGQFKIMVRLNNRINVDLKIDTGSNDTRIPTQVARQLKLLPTQRNILYQSVYGPIQSEEAHLDSLALGPILIRSQNVSYSTKQNKPALDHLGLDILSHFRMLIDFPAHKLYLKPEPEDGAVPNGSKDAKTHKQERPR